MSRDGAEGEAEATKLNATEADYSLCSMTSC